MFVAPPVVVSAYLTLSVWICPTGPVIGCTPTNSLAITVGMTLLITGKITLFRVATLPDDVAPAVACSDRYLRVFSRTTSKFLAFEPSTPSISADLVSCHLLSNIADVIFIFLLFNTC